MTVLFVNNGEIDIRAVTTFGVSVKNSTSALGMFGTGLKYAIAIILRHGGKITIFSGVNKYEFGTATENIRDKDFELITMNGVNLSFTTEQGKTWEVWQAVREILCNCLDEQGEFTTTDEDVEGEEGITKIVVDCLDFEQEYNNRQEFIITPENLKLVVTTPSIDVYFGQTKNLFYKGVKVHKSDKMYKFTYNIKTPVELTEDRTLKYPSSTENYTLPGLLVKLGADEIINSLVSCGDSYAEYHGSYSGTSPCQKLVDKVNSQKMVVNRNIPPSLKTRCAPSLRECLREAPSIRLPAMKEKMLFKAIDFLKAIGFNVDVYKIKVMEDLGKGVLGLADQDNEIIYLSMGVFDMGTKYVAGTLYEEFIHIFYGVSDETRGFQDVVINHLMSLGEAFVGEPV